MALVGNMAVAQAWKAMKSQERQLTFRPAIMADVERIVALVNSAYRGESSRAGWTTEADLLAGQRTDAEEVGNLISSADSLILLGMNGEKIIGSVHLQHGKHVAYLGMLVIQPVMQGHGLGKKLMQAAEATAIKMWGVEKMLMYVVTLRHELIAFYQRRGYHRTGKIKEFPQKVRFGIPKVAGLQIELLEKTL
jgi:ribosomal protein S18 acetylase RimI-like enzyme